MQKNAYMLDFCISNLYVIQKYPENFGSVRHDSDSHCLPQVFEFQYAILHSTKYNIPNN